MKTKRNYNFHQSMASVGKKTPKSTNWNTALDKESTLGVIQGVFKKDFQKRQQDILEIISSNLIITKKETGKLRKEISDFKKY